MKRAISIKDIARESGVSIATVSRVINKTGRYSKETEQRVMDIIRDRNYKPNLVAKGLRVQKMMNVGIVVPDITNEFFVKIVFAVEKILFREGYQTFLCNTDEKDEIERKQVKMMTMQNACGMIFLSSGGDIVLEEDYDLPTVFIDRIPDHLCGNCSVVCSDNVDGGYLATQELLNCGCKKILFITGVRPVSGFRERYEGCLDALREYGLTEENVGICALEYVHYQEAFEKIGALIDAGEFDYDGVFAVSDWLALGAYRALTGHGIDVPAQVKIVGFDDISITDFNTVPISTVRQNVEELAQAAAQQLIDAINGKPMDAREIRIPVCMVPRRSTRADA